MRKSMTRQEEQALIRLAAAGDREATGRLIRAHQSSLYAYMLRMSGSPEMAEDVVQDAFVRVLKNLDRFDPRFRFSTWVFTIAKRLYMNAQQKHKPVFDSDIVGGWERSDDADGRPMVEVELQQRARGAIEFALGELNERQREIVVLFHQQQWPISQIADHLDMPEGTIKSHLHRARTRMRKAITMHRDHERAVAEMWS
jgi:RNA polymerase sigma-70 factor (ECF subfamily)